MNRKNCLHCDVPHCAEDYSKKALRDYKKIVKALQKWEIKKNIKLSTYNGGIEKLATLLNYYCTNVWATDDLKGHPEKIVREIEFLSDFAILIEKWGSILYMRNSDFIAYLPDGSEAMIYRNWVIINNESIISNDPIILWEFDTLI